MEQAREKDSVLSLLDDRQKPVLNEISGSLTKLKIHMKNQRSTEVIKDDTPLGVGRPLAQHLNIWNGALPSYVESSVLSVPHLQAGSSPQ